LAVERRKIEKDQARKKAALEAALKEKESGAAKPTFTEDDIQSIVRVWRTHLNFASILTIFRDATLPDYRAGYYTGGSGGSVAEIKRQP
jgi:hypothetical protein